MDNFTYYNYVKHDKFKKHIINPFVKQYHKTLQIYQFYVGEFKIWWSYI